jgi:hypothetical protein
MRILYHRTMYRIIYRLWYWWHVERSLCKAYNWRTRVCMYLELHDLGWQAHKIELDYLEGIANENP